MKFIADFHVHSKFSRATARNLDLENLYMSAQIKGITVVGTGDFTYPQWFSEIKEKLVPTEPGLFKLKPEIARICDQRIPQSCRGKVRFVLATEISNIYKKEDRTRKNHNLVMVPGLEAAERFSKKLDQIGNIKSDGRPILGLDARDLLEILLETSDQAILIPAHIWTPWFSMLGSKSGFDTIEACFGDLTPHIFAVETGLSSDPPMNWRVSGLDGLTLISNSDAHSPANLGREANIFDTDLSYPSIRSAIETGDAKTFLGTFEFYPEEGKYHLDGHRKCKVSLWPSNTLANKNLCPVCEKPLTLGVLYRVEELANRANGQRPDKTHPYYSTIPLIDILAEILRVGTKSKKVGHHYQTAVQTLGPEFDILHSLTPAYIEKARIPLLSEAIQRMRQKEVSIIPGYDGEYGQVKIFDDQEREQLMGQKSLFVFPHQDSSAKPEKWKRMDFSISSGIDPLESDRNKRMKSQHGRNPAAVLERLNREQRHAVQHPPGPMLIVAGPGTGKTRTLTHRLAHLIKEKHVSPKHMLALTFTNKAAQEMRERLAVLIGDGDRLPLAATFHAFCFKTLQEIDKNQAESIIDDDERKMLISEAVKYVEKNGIEVFLKPQQILNKILSYKQHIQSPEHISKKAGDDPFKRAIAAVYQTYQELLSIQGLNDYEDLIFKFVRKFETDPRVCRRYRNRYQYVFVDEYQDLNQGQYRIIRVLMPPEQSNPNICVIGDPDQSIYGFRGSEIQIFDRFIDDYPNAAIIHLTRNYRSTEAILDASSQMIQAQPDKTRTTRTYSRIRGAKTISILELAHEKAEAEAIGAIIEKLVGGTGFHSIDTGKIDDPNLSKIQSYSDFAVLYRTHDQSRVLAEILQKSGIPVQIASRANALYQFGLSELVSLLKIVEGRGGFFDYQKIMLLLLPGIGQKTLAEFKDWCFEKRFSLQEGLLKIQRFPVPGMKTSKQQKLNDFSRQLKGLENEISGMTVSNKLRFLCENSGFSTLMEKNAQFQDALCNLIASAGRFGTSTGDFLAMTALHSDTDMYASRVEKVSLMTMHAAKGLEFPIVFIAGCEKGYIPFAGSAGEPDQIAEERRLFYVAMTRAKDRLYFTCAKKRSIYGKTEPRELSPFVIDIESCLKKDESPRAKEKKRKDDKQLRLF